MGEDGQDPTTSVLLVEDNFDLQDALVPILEHEGHRVVSASNGREALEKLRVIPPPSLILLDLMMPVMNGEEFRAAQLRDAALASIPVVVLSAHPRARETAARLGAAGCIEKPVDIDVLLDEVRRNAHGSPVDPRPHPSNGGRGARS